MSHQEVIILSPSDNWLDIAEHVPCAKAACSSIMQVLASQTLQLFSLALRYLSRDDRLARSFAYKDTFLSPPNTFTDIQKMIHTKRSFFNIVNREHITHAL